MSRKSELCKSESMDCEPDEEEHGPKDFDADELTGRAYFCEKGRWYTWYRVKWGGSCEITWEPDYYIDNKGLITDFNLKVLELRHWYLVDLENSEEVWLKARKMHRQLARLHKQFHQKLLNESCENGPNRKHSVLSPPETRMKRILDEWELTPKMKVSDPPAKKSLAEINHEIQHLERALADLQSRL